MSIRNPLNLALMMALSVVSLGLSGCTEPEIDIPRFRGGNAPDPAGVIRGSVVYIGPRPQCEYVGGAAVAFTGRVVLTLFDVTLLPPPEGQGTSAANLLTIPGAALFQSLADCMPENPTDEDRAVVVQSSASFEWPEIALAFPDDATDEEETVTYRIQGLYDDDADFNPFFSMTTSTTKGDITGGAVDNPQAASPAFLPVTFGDMDTQSLGQAINGISVTLGFPIVTEQPVFELVSVGLDSEEPLSLEASEVIANFQLATMRMLDRDALDPTDATVEPCAGRFGADIEGFNACCNARYEGNDIAIAMCEGGINTDVSDVGAYAWYTHGIDANGDGLTDPHPTLSPTAQLPTDDGFQPWLSPIVIMSRIPFDYARDADGNIVIDSTTGLPIADPLGAALMEEEAGIPGVTMIPSVNPVPFLSFGTTVTSYPDVGLIVPPIGAMTLNEDDPRCQLPIIPPGTPTSAYETGATVSCQEIPNGLYATVTLQGSAGGTVEPSPVPGVPWTDTGFELTNIGRFAGQSWTVPNEIGDPAQIGNPAASQSLLGSFPVYDSDPTTLNSRQSGAESCQRAEDPDDGNNVRDIVYSDFSEYGADEEAVAASCCCGVAHLCGLPACAPIPVPDGSGNLMHGSPGDVVDGVPNCVPFVMPAACCDRDLTALCGGS